MQNETTNLDTTIEELEALVAPGDGRGAAAVGAGVAVAFLVAAVFVC